MSACNKLVRRYKQHILSLVKIKVRLLSFVCLGCRLRESSQCGFRLSAGTWHGGGQHGIRARTASCRSDLLVLVLFLYGQRDFLSTEAIPSRFGSLSLLEPLPHNYWSALNGHAEAKQRAWILHGRLQWTQVLWQYSCTQLTRRTVWTADDYPADKNGED